LLASPGSPVLRKLFYPKSRLNVEPCRNVRQGAEGKDAWRSDLHLSPLANLSRETGLDGLDRTTRAAVVACDEVETVLALVELGIGGFASLARNVLN
jgi:hypothetical protein